MLLISKNELTFKDAFLANFFPSVGSEVLIAQLWKLPSSEMEKKKPD
jgi:hypothetical protein